MQKEEQNDGTQCLTSEAPYKFPPGPARTGSVFLDQPLARAPQLQPRAVHQEMHGLGITSSTGAGLRPWHHQSLGPATEGGVVRHSKIEPEQAYDGADQAFGLPERQAEHRP